jgi:hypothetical protein
MNQADLEIYRAELFAKYGNKPLEDSHDSPPYPGPVGIMFVCKYTWDAEREKDHDNRAMAVSPES